MAFRRYAKKLPDTDCQELVDRGRACVARGRDPIYLFACHLEWRDHKSLRAYHELIAALDDSDQNIRCLAEALLHRSSPHPRSNTLHPATNPDAREEHYVAGHR